jgi:hypothetical protein
VAAGKLLHLQGTGPTCKLLPEVVPQPLDGQLFTGAYRPGFIPMRAHGSLQEDSHKKAQKATKRKTKVG